MKITKFIKPKVFGLIFLGITISTPHTYASESKPKHIKISNPISAYKHSINIIKGKKAPSPLSNKALKNKEPKNVKPYSVTSHTKTPSYEKYNQKSYNKEILADSLKAYLKSQNRPTQIIDDILYATRTTNTDFSTMILKAMIESDLGRMTIAKNSSARGVFQYIETTWLMLIKRYGDKMGMPEYANAIIINPETLKADIKQDSRFSREELLNLRNNTRIASIIKAYQTKDDEKILKSILTNRSITATDHYIVHMMGVPLAKKFYNLIEHESPVILANIKHHQFQKAVKLNPAFFKDKNGRNLDAKEAYQQFLNKIESRYKMLNAIQSQYSVLKTAYK